MRRGNFQDDGKRVGERVLIKGAQQNQIPMFRKIIKIDFDKHLLSLINVYQYLLRFT